MADLIKQRNMDPEFLESMHLGKLTEFDFEDNLRLKLANLKAANITLTNSYDDTALVQRINTLNQTIIGLRNSITNNTDFYTTGEIDQKLAALRLFDQSLSDAIDSLEQRKLDKTAKIDYDMLTDRTKLLIDKGAEEDTRDLITRADFTEYQETINQTLSNFEVTINGLSNLYVIRNERNSISYDMLTQEIRSMLGGSPQNLTLNNFTSSVASDLQKAINMANSTSGSADVGVFFHNIQSTSDTRPVLLLDSDESNGISALPMLLFNGIATDDIEFYNALTVKAKTFTASTAASSKTMTYKSFTIDLNHMDYIIYLANSTGETVNAKMCYNTLMNSDSEGDYPQVFQDSDLNPLEQFAGIFLYDTQGTLYFVIDDEVFVTVTAGGIGGSSSGGGSESSQYDASSKTWTMSGSTFVQQEITVAAGGTKTIDLPIGNIPASMSVVNVFVLDNTTGSSTKGLFVPIIFDPDVSGVVTYGMAGGTGDSAANKKLTIYNGCQSTRTFRYVFMK